MDKVIFRIWDKEEKKMIYSPCDYTLFNYFIDPFTGNLEIFERPQSYKIFPTEYIIAIVKWYHPGQLNDTTVLLQCTGKKDKKGVYIYEHDIVKLQNKKLKVVKHERGCWWLVDNNNKKKEPLYKYWESNDIEVVGNIYENEEVVKNERRVT